MLALHTETGKTAWKATRPVRTSWTTPIVARTRSGPQIIAAGDTWICAHDPNDGRILWQSRCEGEEMTPSPIYAGGLAIVAAGHNKVYAVRPDGRGDVTKSHWPPHR